MAALWIRNKVSDRAKSARLLHRVCGPKGLYLGNRSGLGPDPVAGAVVLPIIVRGFARATIRGIAAVVHAIFTHGIEQVGSVIVFAVAQWVAIHGVHGDGGEKFGAKRGEAIGKLAML